MASAICILAVLTKEKTRTNTSFRAVVWDFTGRRGKPLIPSKSKFRALVFVSALDAGPATPGACLAGRCAPESTQLPLPIVYCRRRVRYVAAERTVYADAVRHHDPKAIRVKAGNSHLGCRVAV
jgi:hypothetical protein